MGHSNNVCPAQIRHLMVTSDFYITNYDQAEKGKQRGEVSYAVQ